MASVTVVSAHTTAFLLLIVVLALTSAKPRPQHSNPIDSVAFLKPDAVVCTEEVASLCQQCAKQTESVVVYPWCCADHEGAREWCKNYLHFGLR